VCMPAMPEEPTAVAAVATAAVAAEGEPEPKAKPPAKAVLPMPSTVAWLEAGRPDSSEHSAA
jgi:hypothetical protein